MKCKKCGASLYDTDKFCDQCGWKVVKEHRCPECGAALRAGTKFCPKCGRLIGGGEDDDAKVFVKDAEAPDIPITDMEQNILYETEQEIKKAKPVKKAKPAKPAQERQKPGNPDKRSVPAPPPKKKAAPPPPKKRVYEEWDDEDEEDDDEEDGEGLDIMTIVSGVMVFFILAAAAVLIFSLVRKQPTKDYGGQDGETEQTEQQEEEQEQEPEENAGQIQEEQPGNTEPEESTQPLGTLSVVSNVNVRDNPSTDGTKVLKVAKAGETYEYIGMAGNDNWYIILLEDGTTGYVFKEYVSVP